MKQRRNFLLGAITLASVMLFSAPAFATPACGQGAINEAGSVYIEHDGDCVINGGINADWDVTVKATGAITVTGSITSGGQVYLESQGGNLSTDAITATSGAIYIYSAGDLTTGALDSDFETALFPNGNLTINGAATFAYGFTADNSVGNVHITGALTSKDQDYSYLIISAAGLGKTIVLDGNITAPGYDVSLAASGNISTKTIDTHYASSYSSTIRILANTSDSGSTPFVIGAGGSNGINGSVNATRGSGKTIFAVQNGGTGGIDVDGDVIQIQSSSGPSGSLIFKAETGEVKIKGHLSVDGASGQRAGQIVVTANTVKTTGGAQITANDTFETDHNHYVTIAATSLTYTGGLTISVNGNTYSGLYLMPKGSNPVTIDPSPSTIISISPANPLRAPLTVSATDSSPLTLSVTGRNNRVNLSGYPLEFSSGALNINADRSNVYFQYTGVAANNDSLRFNGGTVTVNAYSSIATEPAGTISVFADKIATPTPAVNLLANGGSDGGIIKVQATNGSIPIGVATGKIKINANGGSTAGNGGDITISAPTVTVAGNTLSGTSLLAKPTAANGDGGKVEINATTLTFSETDALISVDGAGSGKGGEIKFNTGSGIIVDHGFAGYISLSAKSDGSGDGGKITLLSGGQQDINAADLRLSAGPSGNGKGGEFTSSSSGYVTITGDIDVKGFGTGRGGKVNVQSGFPLAMFFNIDAKGGDDGLGGEVVLTNVGQFLVNKRIKVSSGTNVSDTNAFAGSIKLNNTKCQQKLVSSTWPKSYWNCVNPETPLVGDDLPVTIAQGLSSTLRSNLEDVKTTIYVQVDKAQFEDFFGAVIPDSSGYTFSEGVGETLNSTLFQNGTTAASGYIAFGTVAKTESTIHEFGHAIDYKYVLESAENSYDAKIAADRDYLNAAGGGAPCSSSGTAPYDDLIDIATGLPFCTGGVLNNPAYAGLTNFEIARTSTPTLNQGNFLGSPGSEVYAQTFAYQRYAKTLTYPNGYFITTADGLFYKGFFGCAQEIAALRAGTSFSSAYSCP